MDERIRRAQYIYNSVLQKTGDRNLAVKAVQAVIDMPQAAPQSTSMRSEVGQNPFGRFGNSPGSIRSQQPNGILSDLQNFGREAFRTLPVTGEVAAGIDAAKQLGAGNYLGAAGAAAMAMPFAGILGRKGKSLLGHNGPPSAPVFGDQTDWRNKQMLNLWSKEAPLGQRPPAEMSPELLDILKNGPRQGSLELRGRHTTDQERRADYEGEAAGMFSGSDVGRKPRPKRDTSSNFTSKKKDAIVNVFDANGRNITLEQARNAAPGVPDDKLQKAVDKLNRAAKGMKKNMSAKEMRDLFKMSLVGIGGSGLGILSMQDGAGDY